MQLTNTAVHAGALDVRQIYRDGELVATLMAVDQGGTYTVVAEVFANDGTGGGAKRRPYVFPDADAAHAFLAEAVTSFTYLGCEIRQL
jgi:hypothetical protein